MGKQLSVRVIDDSCEVPTKRPKIGITLILEENTVKIEQKQ